VLSEIAVDIGSVNNSSLRKGIGTRMLGRVAIVPVCLSGVYSAVALSIQCPGKCT
jgi:hypothetical protein